MAHAPIFIISSERSGSNLLRKRISENQNCYFGPQPAHFFKHLYYGLPFYGNLEDDSNFLKLIEDAILLCKEHFAPWSIDLDSQEILHDFKSVSKERNLFVLADWLMLKYAKSKGYESYICKDNHIFDFIYPIQTYLPEAKFIYLYRDPRDYVLSQLKRNLQVDSIHSIAAMWNREQLKSFQILHPRFNKVFMKLSYEELIENEELVLKRVSSFLNVKLEKGSDIKEFDGIQEWQNLNKPTNSSNSGKFKAELNKNQVQAIEFHCRETMHALDYKPEYSKKAFSRSTILFDELKGRASYMWRKFKLKSSKNKKAEGNLQRSKIIKKFKHA